MNTKVIRLIAAVSVLAMSFTSCGKDVSQRGIDEASSGEIETSVQVYSVTAEVNTVYSAQKLGELAALGEGYKFKFADSENDMKFSTLGKSSVSLRADCDSKETETIALSVNVVDTTSPVFIGIKDITVNAGAVPDLKNGVSVTDNYDQQIEFSVSFDKDDADPNAVGKHVITYVARDSSGNVASRKATLTIQPQAEQTTPVETTAATTQTKKAPQQSSTKTTTATTKPVYKPVTKATTKPASPSGKSDNVKFYQDRVVIAGDSIAYGFCAYGYVPYEHNIAKGSTAMRNYDDKGLFNFDPTGTPLSMMDAIKAVKPSILYVSMGMNDVNLIDDKKYVERYREFIQKAKQAAPGCVIVAASITPIAATSTFTDINKVRACNEGLKKLIAELNDPDVIFFDAYSVIVGSDGVYAAQGTTGPDGIHLTGNCYQMLLERLAVLLDQYGVKDKLS